MPNKLQIRTHVNTIAELQPVLAAILRWANSQESSFAGAAASSVIIQGSPDGSQVTLFPVDDNTAIVFRHNAPSRQLKFDITGGSGTSVLTVDRSVDLRNSGTFAEHNHTHADESAIVGDLIITDVTGSGTISGKSYFDSGGTSPANAQLTDAESDNDSITIAFTVFARGFTWQPLTVTASGAGATPVISVNGSWTQAGSARVFKGTVTLTDADTTGTITLTASDGAVATLAYTRGADPVVVASGARTEQSLTRLGYSRSQTSQAGVTRRVSWV